MTFNEEGVSKYRYADDYIDVVWFVGTKQFNFTLKNKSGHTLKINWDDISYVDTRGRVSRVMHAGVKYAERNDSQPATTVPKGASISDILLPTENVYFVSGQYGGWRESYLIPCVYKTPEAFDASASLTVIYCFCSISILTTLRAFFHRHVWADLFVVTYLCYPILCYVTKCICCFDHGPFRIFLILQYFLLGSI